MANDTLRISSACPPFSTTPTGFSLANFMLLSALCFALLSTSVVLLGLYIYWNDRRLKAIPSSALSFSPSRCTPEEVHAMAKKLAKSPPLTKREVLPEKTGRKYIVVGGGGFLGAWIVTKLIERGEILTSIRILDLNPPANHVVKDALAKGIQFIKVDVTDSVALMGAFKSPWPNPSSTKRDSDITVFHTAANIRFYERNLEFLSRSSRVNVAGTENVLAASKAVGATVLVYTSSGSVGVHSTRFLLWPWETEPQKFVQVINDDDTSLPKAHEQFFSNYAVTKLAAERLVRAADGQTTGIDSSVGEERSTKVMKTGCIRPGNGVFGSRGDMLCGAYLVRKNNPSWIFNVVQSFSYVENCAVAHLLYEARLIELAYSSSEKRNPDIGGQAFCIADPGPTPTYGDVYTTLTTLTQGECHFPSLSPTFMLFLAHGIEFYYRLHNYLLDKGWALARNLPAIKGDIINLQPSLFALTSPHLIFDDSRARLPPSKGGLGYSGAWTTLEGLYKTVEEHKSGVGRSETRSGEAGISFKFSFGFGGKKEVLVRKAVVPDSMKITDAIPVIQHK